jgi:hypothetical protein
LFVCYVTDDSFALDDLGQGPEEDSREFAHLSPPDIQAYLHGRSLKKGFNAWAGKRELEDFYRRLLNMKHASGDYNNLERQRRKPWGGSA